LGGGRHRIDDEGIDLALLLGLHPLIGIEGAVGTVARWNLAADPAGKIGCLKARELVGATLAIEDPRPCLFDSAGKRSDHAETRNDNPTHDISCL
jgi:hypothetical protein